MLSLQYTRIYAEQVHRKEYQSMEVITKMQPISALANSTARIDVIVNIVPGCNCK